MHEIAAFGSTILRAVQTPGTVKGPAGRGRRTALVPPLSRALWASAAACGPAAVGLLLILVFMPASASASTQRSFNAWDVDSDGHIDEQEFRQGIERAGWLARWDGNDDGRIGKQEFDAVGFDARFPQWDSDGSGNLDARELYAGIYSTYDEDNDGEWSLGEWEDAGDAEWFDI